MDCESHCMRQNNKTRVVAFDAAEPKGGEEEGTTTAAWANVEWDGETRASKLCTIFDIDDTLRVEFAAWEFAARNNAKKLENCVDFSSGFIWKL